MILANATWTEVEALDREQVVVIPIGGTELNGASAPMGSASLLADAVASRLHDRLGDEILVVPVLPFATAGGSREMRGTIDLGFELYAAMLRAVVTSLSRQGWRKFLLLQVGPSVETFHALKVAGRELKTQNPLLQIAHFNDGGQNPDRYLAAIASLDPALVKLSDREAIRMDLELEGRRSDDREDLDEAWDREAMFVTDAGEGDAHEWGVTNEVMDVEWGTQILEDITKAAGELIGVMRADRVYLEWA